MDQKVGTTILFESLEGEVDKIADLPEVLLALGKAEFETTSVDDAVVASERVLLGITRTDSLSTTKPRSIRRFMITRHPWERK